MNGAAAWAPQIFTPYDAWPEVVFARVAARSAQFQGTSAAGGRPILVGSAAGHDGVRVAASARGELLERVGNVLAGRAAEAAATLVGDYTDLRRRGVPVLDPVTLDPRASRTARRLWVSGRSALDGDERYVPAGAAFLHHRPAPDCEPRTTAGSTGVAAHPDAARAAEHAAWEVLERDLVRRSWYGLAAAPTRLAAAPLPAPLSELVRGLGLIATALDLPAPRGARCVVVCLHAPDGTGQAFGARCGPRGEPEPLVAKAAYEALMVRWSIGTPVARETWERWQGAGPPRSAVQHALWAYHRQDGLGLWASREPPAHAPVRPTVPARSAVEVLAEHTGQDVVFVDTTAGPARDADVCVIRVVAPGAHALPSGPQDEEYQPCKAQPHPFG